ncbi:hypothetical protein EYZ11_001079 [Aspergillus tanneri]|uniref:DJ-1/PfpI domain-containing protein n=1 Tax=Aspergillus tanneri TaxID=1220188 RepID=A0A4S3JVI8_9EURO|nr:uncharacterized protein ATNIH1004_009711 [Aspergillus tanneri]KAA8642949.1 hypothetical protein ATNIH1004_009711 [Aspergillus tanneri]THC99441.1 hypothetical protein EYZ11_001079 [Aspergillus tanneri]
MLQAFTSVFLRAGLLCLCLSSFGTASDSRTTTFPTPGPKPPNTPPRSYGMVLFRDFEPLDVFGPLEALYRLASLHKLDLYLISETMDAVTTEPGLAAMNPHNSSFFPKILPTHTFDDAPIPDVMIVPGGIGTRSPSLNRTIEYIAETYPKLHYLLTVCTGAGLAAKSGVLDSKHATTNKAAWNTIVAWRPQVNWVPHARWVVDGNIWTSSGISAGIDATMAFIEYAYGKDDATTVGNIMEYERHEDPDWDPFSEVFHVPGA